METVFLDFEPSEGRIDFTMMFFSAVINQNGRELCTDFYL